MAADDTDTAPFGDLLGVTAQHRAHARALMAAGEPAGEARGGVTGAASSRLPVQARGEALPVNATPAFTGLDRWTMVNLWHGGVPDAYASLLRAPLLPAHPGQINLPRPRPQRKR